MRLKCKSIEVPETVLNKVVEACDKANVRISNMRTTNDGVRISIEFARNGITMAKYQKLMGVMSNITDKKVKIVC